MYIIIINLTCCFLYFNVDIRKLKITYMACNIFLWAVLIYRIYTESFFYTFIEIKNCEFIILFYNLLFIY